MLRAKSLFKAICVRGVYVGRVIDSWDRDYSLFRKKKVHTLIQRILHII